MAEKKIQPTNPAVVTRAAKDAKDAKDADDEKANTRKTAHHFRKSGRKTNSAHTRWV